MAVFFRSKTGFGPIAFNSSGTTPSEMYWYPDIKWDVAQMAFALGRRDDDGSLLDGDLTDAIQAMTTDPDMSAMVIEEDDDADSPYRGHIRCKFTMA